MKKTLWGFVRKKCQWVFSIDTRLLTSHLFFIDWISNLSFQSSYEMYFFNLTSHLIICSSSNCKAHLMHRPSSFRLTSIAKPKNFIYQLMSKLQATKNQNTFRTFLKLTKLLCSAVSHSSALQAGEKCLERTANLWPRLHCV